MTPRMLESFPVPPGSRRFFEYGRVIHAGLVPQHGSRITSNPICESRFRKKTACLAFGIPLNSPRHSGMILPGVLTSCRSGFGDQLTVAQTDSHSYRNAHLAAETHAGIPTKSLFRSVSKAAAGELSAAKRVSARSASTVRHCSARADQRRHCRYCSGAESNRSSLESR
jgi:hypothetical protein